MTIMNPRFIEAFSSVLAHDLDRRALLEMLHANREVRYAELRRATGERSAQLFDYAVERLIAHALVNRRLVYRGRRFQSHLSPSGRGLAIAKVLDGLVRTGRLPRNLPAEMLGDVRLVLLGVPPPVPSSQKGGSR